MKLSAEEIKIKTVLNLIGNVDHSEGNGQNAAKMRGQLLNDIRTILTSEIKGCENVAAA